MRSGTAKDWPQFYKMTPQYLRENFFARAVGWIVIGVFALLHGVPWAEGMARAAQLEQHPLDAIAKDANIEEWLTEADGAIRGKLAASDVAVKTLRATPSELSFEFNVKAESSQQGKLIIPLVVPRGEITSTVLQRIDLNGTATSEPATLQLFEATTQELGYVRTYRIATFSLSYEPRALGERHVTGGAVTIAFLPAEPIRDIAAIRFWAKHRVGYFRNLVQKLVANPTDIDRFIVVPEKAIPRGISPALPPPEELERSPFRMRIRVRESGIYRITARDLESSGVVPNWLRPEHLRLFNNGREVPLYWARNASNEGRGFQADDALLFYGTESPSPFSSTNVYWLIYDEHQSHRPIAVAPVPAQQQECESASAYLTKMLIEQDTKVLTRNDQFLSILGYRWVWQELPTSGTFGASFRLPEMLPAGRPLPAVLNLYVYALGETTSSTVCLRVNGGQVRRFAVADERDDRKPFTIAENEIHSGENRFELWVETENKGLATPAGGEHIAAPQIYLDNLEIWYIRPYRLSELPGEIASPYQEDMRVQRAMAYRVALEMPTRNAIVFDVTDQEVKLVPSQIVSTESGRSVLEFRAAESGPRRYAITTPEAALPVSFEPVATSHVDLRSTATQADYLVIAHPDFVEPMRRFVARKEKEGHKVLLVDTQTVYDQFAHGQETPEAIKRFIDYAARYYEAPAGLSPASFVLLVGDATSAYKNEFRNNVINYVPSYTMRSSSSSGEQWASDHWYTRIFGTDDLADVMLGRLSVNNRADLENILSKLEDYEKTSGVQSDWHAHLGFIADHTEFDPPTKRVAELVPPSYSVTRLTLSEEPWEDNFYFPAELTESKRAKVSPEMTRKIRDLFNKGASVVWYFGHGSPNVWSTQRIWFGGDSENSDNLMLRNRDRLPIVLNMTCNSGAIDYPMPRWNVCISEDFMRIPTGGAVACYVPAGPGMVALHEQLSRELVRAIFADRAEPLGNALNLACYRYLAGGYSPDLVRMFILLGDPSMTTAIKPTGGMFTKGLAKASDLKLCGWNFHVTYADERPNTVTLVLTLENLSELPLRDAVVQVTGGDFEAESDAVCFFPRERRDVVILSKAQPGLIPLTLNARCYGAETPVAVGTTAPLTLVVGGADTTQGLCVIPGTVITKHLLSPLVAEVSCQLGNVGKEPVTVLDARLEATGTTEPVQTSAATTGTIEIGGMLSLQFSRPYTDFPDVETARIYVEAVGAETGTTMTVTYPVTLGKAAMPDLTIPEGGILPHKYPIAEGETIFFRVVAENIGNATARNVRVDAYDGLTTGSPPLQSRVIRPFEPIDIPPQSQRIFTVRWDPFANAGVHDLLFRVSSGSVEAERSGENNRREIRLKVLTKYKLRPVGVTILPITQSDINNKQLRIAVKIANEGESAAHGVKVIVYGDKRTKDRKDKLAEDLISEIPGQQTIEHVLVYHPSDKDRGRRLDPWCEVFLKGSLQRVPWPE
ncbi:MAG: C25 family cysteine peptidase [Candidatus Sumerlaeaceae bacterium]|nr:C25 family cysteine peptidase [Candidatus Sumerlaeaceae bacterium]